jgi:hypothetical protein
MKKIFGSTDLTPSLNSKNLSHYCIRNHIRINIQNVMDQKVWVENVPL